MRILTKISIEKFKGLQKITIPLGDPGVIIGPNNSGKTTIIQALTLWHKAVQKRYDIKSTTKNIDNRAGVPIEKTDIANIPIKSFDDLRYEKHTRERNVPVEINISVTIQFKGKEYECDMIFYRYQLALYTKPANTFTTLRKDNYTKTKKIMKHIADLDIALLYPMSGITPTENIEVSGTISVLLGQGKTGQVLRNLCWKLYEQEKEKRHSNWTYIKKTMKALFLIELSDPIAYTKRDGTIDMTYRTIIKQKNNKKNEVLDLSAGGRGQNQMLLLLCFCALHNQSIILFDEPDAHLEILRQKHLYTVLSDISTKRQSQIIMCTHSEIIMNKAELNDIAFLFQGNNIIPQEEEKRKAIHESLSEYGVDQYMMMAIQKKVLYIEGETDLRIIRSLAQYYNPDLVRFLDDRLFYYTTQTQHNEDSPLEDTIVDINRGQEIQKKPNSWQKALTHFDAMKRCIKYSVGEDIHGYGIFDTDGGTARKGTLPKGVYFHYLQRYELENYFIYPSTLQNYVRKISDTHLFNHTTQEEIDKALFDGYLRLFENNKKYIQQFLGYDPNAQQDIIEQKNNKMSKFANIFFTSLAKYTHTNILLNKGDYYRLIDGSITMPSEIDKLLKNMYKFFSQDASQLNN